MRLIKYIRVSDIRGREDSLISPEIQDQQIDGYAQMLSATIVGREEDLGVSGTKMDRPAFNRAVEAVKHGDADGIIVAKLDRFARNAADAGTVVREIEKGAGCLISVHERFDPKNPYDKFTRTIFFAMAELGADTIREGWRAAHANSIVKHGRHLRPVFGYVKTPTGLVPHPTNAEWVMRAFTMRAEGESVGEIRRMFAAAALKTNRGNEWSNGAIVGMLRSQTYLGTAWHGEHTHAHAHEALIDRATWEAAQTSVARVSTKGKQLLAGVARCAGCSYVMMARPQPAAKGGLVYDCVKHTGAGTCPAPTSITVRKLDAYVVEQTVEMLRGMRAESATDTSELRAAERTLELAEAEVGAFVAKESALGEFFAAGLQPRTEAVAARRAELVEIRSRVGRADLPDSAELEETLPLMTPEQLRRLVTSVVGAVFVRRGRVRAPAVERARVVALDDLGAIELPRRGNTNPVIRPYVWTD